MNFIEKMLGIRNDAVEPETEPTATEENPTVPEAGSEVEQADPATDPAEQDVPQPRTFTPEELDDFIAEKRTEWEAEQKAAEAERLKRLPEEDRLKQEKLAAQDELAKMREEIGKLKVRDKLIDYLNQNNYPISLEKILTYTSDEEAAMKNMEELLKTFDEGVNAAVKERLRGKTPLGLGKGHNVNQAMLNRLYGGGEAAKGDAFANALRKE